MWSPLNLGKLERNDGGANCQNSQPFRVPRARHFFIRPQFWMHVISCKN